MAVEEVVPMPADKTDAWRQGRKLGRLAMKASTIMLPSKTQQARPLNHLWIDNLLETCTLDTLRSGWIVATSLHDLTDVEAALKSGEDVCTLAGGNHRRAALKKAHKQEQDGSQSLEDTEVHVTVYRAASDKEIRDLGAMDNQTAAKTLPMTWISVVQAARREAVRRGLKDGQNRTTRARHVLAGQREAYETHSPLLNSYGKENYKRFRATVNTFINLPDEHWNKLETLFLAVSQGQVSVPKGGTHEQFQPDLTPNALQSMRGTGKLDAAMLSVFSRAIDEALQLEDVSVVGQEMSAARSKPKKQSALTEATDRARRAEAALAVCKNALQVRKDEADALYKIANNFPNMNAAMENVRRQFEDKIAAIEADLDAVEDELKGGGSDDEEESGGGSSNKRKRGSD